MIIIFKTKKYQKVKKIVRLFMCMFSLNSLYLLSNEGLLRHISVLTMFPGTNQYLQINWVE